MKNTLLFSLIVLFAGNAVVVPTARANDIPQALAEDSSTNPAFAVAAIATAITVFYLEFNKPEKKSSDTVTPDNDLRAGSTLDKNTQFTTLFNNVLKKYYQLSALSDKVGPIMHKAVSAGLIIYVGKGLFTLALKDIMNNVSRSYAFGLGLFAKKQ